MVDVCLQYEAYEEYEGYEERFVSKGRVTQISSIQCSMEQGVSIGFLSKGHILNINIRN